MTVSRRKIQNFQTCHTKEKRARHAPQRTTAAFMVVALSASQGEAAPMQDRPQGGTTDVPPRTDITGLSCLPTFHPKPAAPQARLSKDVRGRPVLTIGMPPCGEGAKTTAQKTTNSNLVPLRHSDIQLEITNLRFTERSVSFTADSRKVSMLRLMFASDGHLYEGAYDRNRPCPTVVATPGQVTHRQDGPLYHVTVRLPPETVRQIQQYRCSYHPRLSF